MTTPEGYGHRRACSSVSIFLYYYYQFFSCYKNCILFVWFTAQEWTRESLQSCRVATGRGPGTSRGSGGHHRGPSKAASRASQ